VGLALARKIPVLGAAFVANQNLLSARRPNRFPAPAQGGCESFYPELVNRVGALLQPGTVYNNKGNHFRIGSGRKNLPEAIARVEEFLHLRRG
jgi:hypothetical protein